MVDSNPAGETPEFIPVSELARLAGYTRAHIYQQIAGGCGLVLHPHKGVALPDAVEWLRRNSRAAKERARVAKQRALDANRTARAETMKRLRAAYEAVVAKEGVT